MKPLDRFVVGEDERKQEQAKDSDGCERYGVCIPDRCEPCEVARFS